MTRHKSSAARAAALVPALLLMAFGATACFDRPTSVVAVGPTVSVAVDEQAYVADTYPIDPYNSDTTAIHVSEAAGQEVARSFVHLDTTAVSALAVKSLVVSLHPPAGTPATQSVSPATIRACVLTQRLAKPFNPSTPPAYDCGFARASGTQSADGSWSFDVEPLLAWWRTHTNTGLALVPSALSTTDAWQQAFDVKATTAAATPGVAPTPAPSTSPTSEAPTSPANALTQPPPPAQYPPLNPLTQPASAPTPTAAPATASPPATPAPAAAPVGVVGGAAVPPASSGAETTIPRWLVALACCLGIMVLVLVALSMRRRRPSDSARLADRGPRTRLGLVRENPSVSAAIAGLILTGFVVSGFAGTQASNNAGSPLAIGASPDLSNPGSAVPQGIGPSGSGTPAPGQSGPSGPTPSSATTPQSSTSTSAGSSAAGGHPAATPVPAERSCVWYCDIAYAGNGTTPYGPAAAPATGNGGATAQGVDGSTINIAMIGSSNQQSVSGVGDLGGGYQAYANRINQTEGGVYGRKVVFHYYSTSNDTPQGGVDAAKQAAANDFSAVIINGVDGAEAAGRTLSEYGIPFLDGQSSLQSLASQPTVFTIISPIEDHARQLVDYLVRLGHGHDTTCVFMTNLNLWLASAKPAMLDEAKRVGMNIPVFAETQSTQTSFTSELQSMKNAGCTVVIMFTELEEVGIVRDAQAMAWNPTFTGDEWTDDVLVQGQYGAANEFAGMKVLRIFGTSDQPGFQQYMSDHQQYDSSDTAIPDAAVHYASAEVFIEALKRAGPNLTHRTLEEALFTLRRFSTGGLLDDQTFTTQDRSGSHTVFSAKCCGPGSDGTTRWVILDGWRRYPSA